MKFLEKLFEQFNAWSAPIMSIRHGTHRLSKKCGSRANMRSRVMMSPKNRHLPKALPIGVRSIERVTTNKTYPGEGKAWTSFVPKPRLLFGWRTLFILIHRKLLRPSFEARVVKLATTRRVIAILLVLRKRSHLSKTAAGCISK